MTDCGFCLRDGVSDIASAGSCVICGREACAYPSGRRDGIFHGEICKCACGDFVCKRDFPRHSRGHGPGRAPSTCFPTATSISASGALAVVEEHASSRLGSAVPTAEIDHIHDFLTHIAATVDFVHAGIRHVEGARIGAITADEIPDRLANILRQPLRMMLLAPIAFNNLRVAWTRAPAAGRVREYFSNVAHRIDRMADALNASRPLRDPLSPIAIYAYAELSPRIAERLTEIRRLSLPKFRSPLDLHPFFATTLPSLPEAAPQISLIEPTLSAYLPRGQVRLQS